MKKKEWIKTICFIAGFFLILIPLTYIIRTNGDIKDIFVGFYAEKEDTIDVVMIGSSPVYPYYAGPKIWKDTGITCYPLSSNMQRPKAAVHLVEEAEKTQDPGLYIFELRMYLGPDERLTQNMAYTRGVTDNMKYSWNRIKTINALVDPDGPEPRYTYYFDIFKYHSNWKTMVLPSQIVTFRYEWPDSLKGAVIRDDVGPSEIADFSWVTERQAIPEDQEEVLRELLSCLQEKGLNALFIISPNTMTEEKQRQYNYIADIIAPTGYGFLNLNDYYEELGIDFETDFDDYGGHTNAFGMEKCSAFLGEYLSTHYDFEDKRGREGYESWDKAAELWEEQTESAKQTILDKIARKEFKVIEEEE